MGSSRRRVQSKVQVNWFRAADNPGISAPAACSEPKSDLASKPKTSYSEHLSPSMRRARDASTSEKIFLIAQSLIVPFLTNLLRRLSRFELWGHIKHRSGPVWPLRPRSCSLSQHHNPHTAHTHTCADKVIAQNTGQAPMEGH